MALKVVAATRIDFAMHLSAKSTTVLQINYDLLTADPTFTQLTLLSSLAD